jgi:glycosyltransferase involved in cell wall biosynthesis
VSKTILDLAIIIPTLNEEHYIGQLLDSIVSQTVLPKEIVVVDANSQDKTILEIEKRQKQALSQLKYYQIPKYTISRQRNLGVKKTTAQNLLFLDADMVFYQTDSLIKFYEEIQKKKAGFAIPKILPISQKKRDLFLYSLHNGIPKLFKPFKPLATTQCLFVKRDLFNQVGGFDEEIKVAEDFEFISRLQKANGKFVILKKTVVYNSVRRLDKDGRLKYVGLLGISLLFILLLGYRKNPIHKKYELGNHPQPK